MKKTGLIIAVIAICLGGVCGMLHSQNISDTVKFPRSTVTLLVKNQNIDWSVEIAKTSEQLMHGLMYRTELPDKTGMIFLFPVEQSVTMWMKNTFVSLDMLFFNTQGKIVHIIEKTTPESTDLLSYFGRARGVFEVPAGSVQKYDIRIGDVLDINSL